ncbi:hypothetical protein DFP72DRAFT_1124467 [Ephemerocybe angulata]|nr:hypothetical protein DFP72DRAFT_1124467 [Tulosesus angulatus]
MESRLDQARHLEPRISAVEAKIVDQTIDGAVVQALLSRLGQLEHTTGALGSRLGEMERQLAEVLAQKRERDDELLEKLAALDESLKAASGGIAGRDHVQASIAEHEARIEASLDHRFGELAATIAASQANTLQLLESTHGPTRDDLFLPAQSFNHGREDFSGYDRRSGNGGLVRMDLMGSEIAGQRDGGLDRGQNLLAGSSHANEQWEGQDGGNVANRASGQSVTSQSVPMPISGYGMSASLAGQARGHPASGPQHGSYAAGDSASLAGHAHGHAASGPQHGSYAPSDWGADSTLSSVPSNVSSIGNPQSQRKPHGGPY